MRNITNKTQDDTMQESEKKFVHSKYITNNELIDVCCFRVKNDTLVTLTVRDNNVKLTHVVC